MSNAPAVNCHTFSRFLYNHNPFYLISALLVLIGLHKALGTDSSVTGGWLLMGVLCGYTLLLATAGYVIVRFGQVWEDARMILLVIVLLFLALSVSFDRIVLENPALGARFLCLGLAFSVMLSEGVFRCVHIRLGRRYRLPYYCMLALLFAYPIVLGHLSVTGQNAAMAWGVFLFPLAAAVVLLTLWPAARAKGRQEPPNGTPWNWPWYPWPLFVFLLVAILLRSYSLSTAFEASKGMAASFQPYFITPIILATSLLLLEIGIVNAARRVQQLALLLPILVLGLSFPGSQLNPVAQRFLTLLTTSAGSPAQLALAGLGIFYGLAWRRGFRSAEFALISCALIASVVGRQTVSLGTLSEIQPWPLAVLAIWQLPWGLLRRSYRRTVVGAAAGMLALSVSSELVKPWLPSQYVLTHASAVLLLFLATLYDDRWARLMRRLAVVLVPVAGLVAATSYEFVYPQIPRLQHAVYLSALMATAVLFWYRRAAMPELLATIASGGSVLLFGSRSLYLLLESSLLSKGLPWIACGLSALGVALLLSFCKGGLVDRCWLLLKSINRV